VRIVLRGDQRQAAPHVHDADVGLCAGETITVTPMKAFPVIKDLVTDVSWNYEVNKRIPAFQPAPRCSRRHLADVSIRGRAAAGIP